MRLIPGMHRLCRSLPALFLGLLISFSARAEEPARLAEAPVTAADVGVAFWNIQWFPGGRPDASAPEEARQTELVHAEITRLKADVIGLEEVRDWQAAELALKPLPGFKVDVISNFPPRENQAEAQQVVLASRLPAVSAWSELWQAEGPLAPPRGFAFAAYQIAPKHLLMVYVVHLKSNGGEHSENVRLREESARQLVAHMKAMATAYEKLGRLSWIVGGDFNTSLDDPRFRNEQTMPRLFAAGFAWAWRNVPFAQRQTIAADRRFPAACFDHILYKNASLREAAMVETAKDASDHRAIRARFDLTRN